MKRILGLMAAGLILVVGCSSNSGPPVATPTPHPWIDKCPDPVYIMSRSDEFPDEVPTTFSESYADLGDNWNDRVSYIWVLQGAEIRVFYDRYYPDEMEANFEDLSSPDRKMTRTRFYTSSFSGVSSVMIRKCSNPRISPSPS